MRPVKSLNGGLDLQLLKTLERRRDYYYYIEGFKEHSLNLTPHNQQRC